MWPLPFSPQPFYISFLLYLRFHCSCRGSSTASKRVSEQERREKARVSHRLFFYQLVYLGWVVFVSCQGPAETLLLSIVLIYKSCFCCTHWRLVGELKASRHFTLSLSACVGEVCLGVRPVSGRPSITSFFFTLLVMNPHLLFSENLDRENPLEALFVSNSDQQTVFGSNY